MMIAWWIIVAALAPILTYLSWCVVVGLVCGFVEGLGLKRRPKFKVVHFEEE